MDASRLTDFGAGSDFIQRYYQLLLETPERAHQLYKEKSTLTRVLSHEEEWSASTVLGIHSVLILLNYTGIELSHVKCNASLNEGISAMVFGSVKSRNFSGWRKFSQVFLLAHQDHGYYVLGYIFGYVEEAIPDVKVDPEVPKSADLVVQGSDFPVSGPCYTKHARKRTRFSDSCSENDSDGCVCQIFLHHIYTQKDGVFRPR